MFTMKQWVTIPQAAQWLSTFFEEEVNEADVLKLGIDGYLKLSVNFFDCQFGKLCPVIKADVGEPPEEIYKFIPEIGMVGKPKGNNYVLEGVYDLPLIGGERIDVKHKWQELRGLQVTPSVRLVNAYVVGREGQLYELQLFKASFLEKESTVFMLNPHSFPEDYNPTSSLPQNSEIVIRTQALRELTSSYDNIISEREKQPVEKEELAVLTKVIDPSHPWHSPPLALAVKAWVELYASRIGNKDNNMYKESGGNTQLIEGWLKKEIPGIGPTTVDHYRYIINPSKKGGPTRSCD